MATTGKTLTHNDYTVGLIYVKPLEMNAIIPMLDERHEQLRLNEDDDNEYTLGRIGAHNVMVVGPPIGEQGKVAISTVVNQIRLSFKNVRVGLLVGIGGGVPKHDHDVRLGDVVVGAPECGPAVVQYDLGEFGKEDDITVKRTLAKPPRALLNVVKRVENHHQMLKKGESLPFLRHLERFANYPRIIKTFSRPQHPDLLFLPDFLHEDGTDCISHGASYQVPRKDRPQDALVEVHYSTILSGDLVMKNGLKRDKISAQHYNALCFEMEAAGLMDKFSCLVIRGICDYADSHKSKEWQSYAAATAAAYAREILCNMAERVASDLQPSRTESQRVAEEKAEADERDEFLRMLSFPEMNSRESSVQSAYPDTYEWVRDSEEYKAWRDTQGGKLLIKGKAGCGKSTLMKHLFKMERDSEAGFIVCGFFFNDTGTQLERSIDAMLRTIVHGFVFQHPAGFKDLRKFYTERKSREKTQTTEAIWTREQLDQMFTILMNSPRLRGLIYIDALDEGEGFDESTIFNLLEEQLNRPREFHTNWRICLSSRPTNFVDRMTAWTTIDLGKGNSKDIEIYTTKQLQQTARACSKYEDIVSELSEEILRKADGIFLWAKIVVERLQKAMNRIESENDIINTLGAVPESLYKLFENCLGRVEKKFLHRTAQILQIVLAAERPLSIDELADLMSVSDFSANTRTAKGVKERRQTKITAEEICQMKRDIRNWSGGLVEVVETRGGVGYRKPIFSFGPETDLRRRRCDCTLIPKARFIHQSMKDFLRESPQLDILGLVDEVTSHKLLLSLCIRYLENLRLLNFNGGTADNGWVPGPTYDSVDSHEGNPWDGVAQEHPFFIYAPFWIKHAEKCEPKTLGKDIIQKTETTFKTWLSTGKRGSRQYAYTFYLRDFYATLYKINRYESPIAYSSLLAFCANCCFINLFKALLFCTDIGYDRKTLDNALVGACTLGLEYRELYALHGFFWMGFLGRDLSFPAPSLSEKDHSINDMMADLLIKKGADVNLRGHPARGRFQTPLVAASWWGRLNLVKMLVQNKADINPVPQDTSPPPDLPSPWNHMTPLIAACWGGNTPVVRFLISCGAQVDFKAKDIAGTALVGSIRRSNIKAIKLLLDSHATVDMLLGPDIPGSALTVAASEGEIDIVKYLISRGANINLKSPGGSPLSAAASNSKKVGTTIMKYLIDNGAQVQDISHNDAHGSILLSVIRGKAPESVTISRIELLVKHGIDVNTKFNEGPYASALIAAACVGDGPFANQDIEILRCLIRLGAEVNYQATVGKYGSALIAAVWAGSYNCDHTKINFLLENGADINLPSLTGDFKSALEVLKDLKKNKTAENHDPDCKCRHPPGSESTGSFHRITFTL
ncbi:SH3 and multiple ankyrin repeat domains protein 2 [Orbilia oligospora]|nr:SH3 and multiple ankyrin repeat domains protein 2 [Orbilia oligospora]